MKVAGGRSDKSTMTSTPCTPALPARATVPPPGRVPARTRVRFSAYSVFNLLGAGAVGAILHALLNRQLPFSQTLYASPRQYVAVVAVLAGAAPFLAVLALRASRRMNRAVAGAMLVTVLVAELLASRQGMLAPLTQTVDRTPAPYVMFTLAPSAQWLDGAAPLLSGGALGKPPFETNDLGYRGPRPVMPKPAGEYRILMIGGSTTMLGAPIENTIGGQLERRFHDSGRSDVCVYNWGVPSAAAGEELAAMVHRAPDFAPDLVLVYDGANDAYGPMLADPRPGYPYNFCSIEFGHELLRGRGDLRDAALLFAQRSALFRTFFSSTLDGRLLDRDALRRAVGHGSLGWQRQIADLYGERVRRMAAIGPALGFKVAVYVQPVRALLRDNPSDEDRMALQILDAMVTAVYARIPESSDSFQFVDARDALAAFDESEFWDQVHVTNAGNAAVADRIFEQLAPFAVCENQSSLTASAAP